MKANYYRILESCIEKGIERGYARAFKHTDAPTGDLIETEIQRYIMLEISEYFNFDGND